VWEGRGREAPSYPILRPHAAEVVKKNGEMELNGIVIPNPHNQCRPEPTPCALSIQLGMQIIQQKDEVTLLYLSDHQVRQVRMNVPHSDHPTPTWLGESVGHELDRTVRPAPPGQKLAIRHGLRTAIKRLASLPNSFAACLTARPESEAFTHPTSLAGLRLTK
jgi:hypothetical protein